MVALSKVALPLCEVVILINFLEKAVLVEIDDLFDLFPYKLFLDT